MYARLITFNIGPESSTKARQLIDMFLPYLRSCEEFRGVTFFGDNATGDYGALVLWDSSKAVETEGTVIIPRLQDALASLIKKPPSFRVFEVFETQEKPESPNGDYFAQRRHIR